MCIYIYMCVNLAPGKAILTSNLEYTCACLLVDGYRVRFVELQLLRIVVQ